MKTCPKCGGGYEEALRFCPRDGEVLEDSPHALVGRVLDGQYEIEAFVASGGMGTVYRARHILLGDRVALKTLKPEMQANGEWLRRFQREGRAARRFRHPNSVQVYDLRTSSDGLVYMVMEFVEGATLDRELNERGRFAPAAALEVLEPVARVLDAAHAQGVVHRDLKPENVMLSRDAAGAPHVKLLDLGIAKLRDIADTRRLDSGQAALTMAGQVLGTPYYMSPEQWGELPRDGNPEIDGRADIYSLGVIFYELVAGRRPFGGKTLAEFRQAHAVGRPQRLDLVEPDVPAGFARAVERAMAKDRADRFATAGEFVAELRDSLTHTSGGDRFEGESEHSRTLVHGELPPGALASDAGGFAGPPWEAGGANSEAGGPRRTSEPSAVSLGAPTVLLDEADAAEEKHTAANAPRRERDRYDTIADPKLSTRSAAHVRTLRDTGPPANPGDADATGANRTGADATRVGATGSNAAVSNAAESNATGVGAADADATSVGAAGVSAMGENAAGLSSAAGGRQSAAALFSRTPAVGAPAGEWGVPPYERDAPAAGSRVPEVVRGRARRGPLVVAGVAALLLLCALGAGGWFVWSRFRPVGEGAAATEATPATTSGPVAAVEAVSYWIEVFEGAEDETGARVARAGAITLESGQQFKFHFSPRERGYFYIVGPGEGNAARTFLTARPVGVLKTNQAAAGSDFTFPYGDGQVLQLDNNPGTEEYTVIFSRTPLLEPAFLVARAGRELTPAEVKELEDLRARAQTGATPQAVKEAGGAATVVVSAPDGAGDERPVVFDIRIEHR